MAVSLKCYLLYLQKLRTIAGVLGSLNSPASGLVGVLNSVIRDLLSVVEEIEKQKAA